MRFFVDLMAGCAKIVRPVVAPQTVVVFARFSVLQTWPMILWKMLHKNISAKSVISHVFPRNPWLEKCPLLARGLPSAKLTSRMNYLLFLTHKGNLCVWNANVAPLKQMFLVLWKPFAMELTLQIVVRPLEPRDVPLVFPSLDCLLKWSLASKSFADQM